VTESFSAEIVSAGQGGHAVIVPKEVAAAFSGKRVPVLAHVNGVEYRSRLMVYGGKSFDSLERVRGIVQKLPSIERIVLVPYLTATPAQQALLDKIVQRPKTTWFGHWQPDSEITDRVKKVAGDTPPDQAAPPADPTDETPPVA